MSTQDSQRGAPGSGRLVALIVSIWGWMVDGMAAFGTVLIVVLMGIICSDVVARNLFNASLPLVAELGALTLVMIVYLQLGAAVRHNRLARAEILLAALQAKAPRAAALLEACFQLVGAAMLALIAWSTLGIMEADIARGRYIGVTGVITLQTWPFRLVILFGVCIATIQFLVQMVSALTRDAPARETAA
ncbi:TRAP transporter small permease subunit [Chelativorans sp. ZYF759]|uniref:TRAP transporter small permease subunit n=1 Tax=Chelativorans sp. ZYF759 TaxID=2692213 RepID=UPI00145EBFEA|nr:TRAP transporter small permease subunit [Chelativorans sp. ZYF759]